MSIDEHRPTLAASLLRRFYVYSYRFAWLLVALFSAAGWMRMIDAIRDFDWLELAGTQPGALYLVISGAAWGVVGLIAVLWLLSRCPWGRTTGVIAALFFGLTFWLDRLLFNRAPGAQSNTGFALLATLLILAVVISGLRPFTELSTLSRRRLTRKYGDP